MKSKLLIAALLLVSPLFTNNVKAQGGLSPMENKDEHGDSHRKEELESFKIGFITRRVNLNAEEAKAFWPVYNQYQSEIDALRKKHRHENMDAKENFESLTDAEIEKVVDNEIIFRQNELDVIKKYHADFKRILKPRKLALFYKAQEDFKRELINRIREHRGDKF